MNGPTDAALPAALAGAEVTAPVLALRPDYRAVLVVAAGVRGGPSDAASDAALRHAEDVARARLAGGPPEALAEIAAWRDAFLMFGVKPRQARSSVEALLRRVDAGLPRIDRLTDLYNAVSIEHLIPVGGEDLDRYVGPPRLVRATGHEPFDTIAEGAPTTLTPDPEEVAWRDDVGITCRRWNWRQCVRTRLRQDTQNALFILDALAPVSNDEVHEAADDLIARLRRATPDVQVSLRLLPATNPQRST